MCQRRISGQWNADQAAAAPDNAPFIGFHRWARCPAGVGAAKTQLAQADAAENDRAATTGLPESGPERHAMTIRDRTGPWPEGPTRRDCTTPEAIDPGALAVGRQEGDETAPRKVMGLGIVPLAVDDA
jgi:hypothetical protein